MGGLCYLFVEGSEQRPKTIRQESRLGVLVAESRETAEQVVAFYKASGVTLHLTIASPTVTDRWISELAKVSDCVAVFLVESVHTSGPKVSLITQADWRLRYEVWSPETCEKIREAITLASKAAEIAREEDEALVEEWFGELSESAAEIKALWRPETFIELIQRVRSTVSPKYPQVEVDIFDNPHLDRNASTAEVVTNANYSQVFIPIVVALREAGVSEEDIENGFMEPLRLAGDDPEKNWSVILSTVTIKGV